MKFLELTFGGGISIDAQHPNKMKLAGVLVRLNEASDKPPNGSKGHRIMVPNDVAEKRLSTIVGMGLNYSPSLDGHAQRRKVGVINKAWIDGNNVHVEGTIWKHDFPEAERDLKQDNLGMSMEIGDVHVEDVDAHVWKITDFKFLGATILYRKAAAYHQTHAIAAMAASIERRMDMAEKKATSKNGNGTGAIQLSAKQIATIASQAARAAVKPFADIVDRQTDLLAGINARMEALDLEVTARKSEDDETDDEEADADMQVPNMRVKKAEAAAVDDEEARSKNEEEKEDGEDDGDDDDDDMDSAIDKGDLEDLGEANDEDDDDPGHLNQDTTNKGSKTTAEDKVGKNVNKAVTGAAYNVLKSKFAEVLAEMQAMRKENKKIKAALKATKGQVIKASAEIGRRSVAYPQEVAGLLRKNGIDPIQLQASGDKLSVEQVDGMLADMRGLSNVDRINLKNRLVEHGAMDEGRVDRGYTLPGNRN